LNHPPPAGGGIQEIVFAVGRLGLNDPPPAGGGIPVRQNSKNLGNDKALKRRANVSRRSRGENQTVFSKVF
jgi:hypothetical protein